MSMTWKEIIATARLAGCRRERYFTTALMALIPHEAPGLGTIGVTKDWIMMVDPVAVTAWGVEKATTVIRHEVRHCLRDHHGRGEVLGGEEFDRLKNIAGDAEINDGEEFRGDPWPDGAVTPSALGMPDGLLMEEYFDLLRKQAEQQQAKGKGSGGKDKKDGESSSGESSSGESSSKEGEGEGEGEGSKPSAGHGWCGSCAGRAMPGEPSTEGNSKDGDGDAAHGPVEGRSEVEQRRIRKQVAEAIKQEAQRGRGTVPAGWVRWADAQLSPPKIPWQQKLAKVMRATIAYRAGAIDRKYQHTSRRQAGIGYGVGKPRLPGLRAPVPNVAVVIDTSGSMGQKELDAAVAETAGVLKAVGSDIDFCACDAEVHSLASVRNYRDLSKHMKGGGGTSFIPAFVALSSRKRRPEIVVFITDGCGPAPEQQPDGMKTIWVLVGAHKQHPTTGGGQCTWGEFIEVS